MSSKIKNSPMFALVFDILKRFFWLPLIYTILDVVIISTIASRSRFSGSNFFTFERAVNTLDYEFPIHIIAIIIAALLGSTILSYLSRVSSATFIHSLPLRREKLFFANYIAGALLLLIPSLISALYLAFFVSSLPYGLMYLTVNAIYTLGVFSFAICVSQLSSNVIGSMVFTAVGLATPIICEGFFYVLCESNLYGFVADYEFILSQYVYLTPERVFSPRGIIYLAVILIGTLLGLLLYKKRSIELAGDLVTFSSTRKLIIFVCGLLCAMAAYLIFGASLISFLIFGTICSILVNFAVRKKFTIKGGIIPAASIIILTIVIVVTFRFDLTGFERRIPEIESIESVMIGDRYASDARTTYLSQSNRRVRYALKENVTNSADIEKVIALHENLLLNEDYYSNGIERSGNFMIEYTLKNGRTLRRQYRIYYERNAAAFEGVTEIPQLRREDHEILADNVKITKLDFKGLNGKSRDFHGREMERLIEAMKYDLLHSDYDKNPDYFDMSGYYDTGFDFTYYFTDAVYEDTGEKVPERLLQEYLTYGSYERLYPHYTQTMKVLSEIAPDLVTFDFEIPEDSSMVLTVYNESYKDDYYGDAIYYGDYVDVEIVTVAEKYGMSEEQYYITDHDDIRAILSEMFKYTSVRSERQNGKMVYDNYSVSFKGEDFYTNASITSKSKIIEDCIVRASKLSSEDIILE